MCNWAVSYLLTSMPAFLCGRLCNVNELVSILAEVAGTAGAIFPSGLLALSFLAVSGMLMLYQMRRWKY